MHDELAALQARLLASKGNNAYASESRRRVIAAQVPEAEESPAYKAEQRDARRQGILSASSWKNPSKRISQSAATRSKERAARVKARCQCGGDVTVHALLCK